MSTNKWFHIPCLLLVFSVLASGQGIPPAVGSIGDRTNQNSPITEFQAPKEDTVTVRHFTLADLSKETLFKDTLLDDFEKYSILRSFKQGSLNLGNYGSSHLNIIYNPKDDILTDPGFHQYDNYKVNFNNFKYYKTGEAFNDLAFTPVAGKENFQVQARFSNNFADDINLSLQLDRISQEGFYNDQATKSTALGVGFWKNNKEKNHQLFFTYLVNNHNEEQSGGTIDPQVSRLRTEVDTYLSNAKTRHESFQYALDNFFSLKSKYQLHHQLQLGHGYFLYSDEDVVSENDTLIYRENYITDAKGIRYHMGMTKVRNAIDLGFETKGIGLEVGLLHQWAKYSKDVDVEHIHDLVAHGEVNLSLKKVAKLKARAELGLGSNAGNLKLNGLLTVRPYKDLQVNGQVRIIRYDPTLIQRELSVTQSTIYQNDFSKVNELLINGTLIWDRLNLELEFNSGLIDQPIYLNEQALPTQKDGTTEYIQGMLSHRLFWKFIGLENSVCYQSFTDNIYKLPQWYSIHNAYLQFPLFKKRLLTRIGGLFYNLQMSEALAYFPITGGFYPTDSPIADYPYMEAYVNFKISDFRMFVKMENLNDLFYPLEHYQIQNYPQFDAKLRMGVRWVMRG